MAVRLTDLTPAEQRAHVLIRGFMRRVLRIQDPSTPDRDAAGLAEMAARQTALELGQHGYLATVPGDTYTLSRSWVWLPHEADTVPRLARWYYDEVHVWQTFELAAPRHRRPALRAAERAVRHVRAFSDDARPRDASTDV